jgi:hypothetical protein
MLRWPLPVKADRAFRSSLRAMEPRRLGAFAARMAATSPQATAARLSLADAFAYQTC